MGVTRRALMVMVAALTLVGPAHARDKAPVVLAAASLQEPLSEAATRWAAIGHVRPILSFASSAALARQVVAGAPADLFISADMAWMDELDRRGLLAAGTRVTFLGNRLVLITPRNRPIRVNFGNPAALAATLGAGPLAMADVNAVPAGRYGRAALESLGIWARVRSRVVQADNVRAALALVERGAAPFGIVYATDARASHEVAIAGVFSSRSHMPIHYPIARLKTSTNREGEGFRRFLISPAGRAIFVRHGFSAG